MKPEKPSTLICVNPDCPAYWPYPQDGVLVAQRVCLICGQPVRRVPFALHEIDGKPAQDCVTQLAQGAL